MKQLSLVKLDRRFEEKKFQTSLSQLKHTNNPEVSTPLTMREITMICTTLFQLRRKLHTSDTVRVVRFSERKSLEATCDFDFVWMFFLFSFSKFSRASSKVSFLHKRVETINSLSVHCNLPPALFVYDLLMYAHRNEGSWASCNEKQVVRWTMEIFLPRGVVEFFKENAQELIQLKESKSCVDWTCKQPRGSSHWPQLTRSTHGNDQVYCFRPLKSLISIVNFLLINCVSQNCSAEFFKILSIFPRKNILLMTYLKWVKTTNTATQLWRFYVSFANCFFMRQQKKNENFNVFV